MKKLTISLSFVLALNAFFINPTFAYSFKQAKRHAKIATGIAFAALAFRLEDKSEIFNQLAIGNFNAQCAAFAHNNPDLNAPLNPLYLLINAHINNSVEFAKNYKSTHNQVKFLSLLLSIICFKSAYNDYNNNEYNQESKNI